MPSVWSEMRFVICVQQNLWYNASSTHRPREDAPGQGRHVAVDAGLCREGRTAGLRKDTWKL